MASISRASFCERRTKVKLWRSGGKITICLSFFDLVADPPRSVTSSRVSRAMRGVKWTPSRTRLQFEVMELTVGVRIAFLASCPSVLDAVRNVILVACVQSQPGVLEFASEIWHPVAWKAAIGRSDGHLDSDRKLPGFRRRACARPRSSANRLVPPTSTLSARCGENKCAYV